MRCGCRDKPTDDQSAVRVFKQPRYSSGANELAALSSLLRLVMGTSCGWAVVYRYDQTRGSLSTGIPPERAVDIWWHRGTVNDMYALLR